MPDAKDLPSNLRRLAKHQAITLRNRQFDQDFAVLVETLRKELGADKPNREGANGFTAIFVFHAKKFREQLRHYRDSHPRVGYYVAASLLAAVLGEVIYYMEAPVGRV